MLVRILTFFRGYVSLLVQGHFIERFINICTRRNIYLWDISKNEPNRAHMKMSIRGFKQIRPIARKTHTRVRILKKQGYPILVRRYRKRYFFFAGLAVIILFIAVLSQFVWSIEVVGNELVSTEEIMQTLESIGLKEGSFRGGIDPVALKNDALLYLDGLSWIWVDIRGCKAVVNVKEKTPAPEMVPKDAPCDIIAAKAGVIKVVNAKNGYSAVLPGETVQAGQLLVKGTITSERTDTRYVHSMGDVFARTWYEKTAVYPPEKEVRRLTGNKIDRRSIKIFGTTINFYINSSIPYANYDKIDTKNEWQVGGNFLGVTWQTESFMEVEMSKVPASVERNLVVGEAALFGEIVKEVTPGSEIAAKSVSHKVLEDGSVSITMTVEFIEQIGIQQPLQIPEGTPSDGETENAQ